VCRSEKQNEQREKERLLCFYLSWRGKKGGRTSKESTFVSGILIYANCLLGAGPIEVLLLKFLLPKRQNTRNIRSLVTRTKERASS
jgi:hypothetical protein